MVRPLRVILILAATASLALAVGCGSDSSSGAAEPTTTEAAPATTAPVTTAPETTEATTEETTTAAPPEAEGDAAAGQTVFAASCTACHTNNGQDAGVGPKLAGAGLTADVVENQVVNGGGAMPAGLVSGTDLDNVVAYVVSIQ
jgi:mono/diheme cytochrome c family protein